MLSRDFPDIYSIGSKLEVAIQFKNTFTTQILSQSDNRKQRYSILDHIFGPSSGTLGPIPKKFLMDNLPIMAGYRSKYQPSRSNTVGGVALQRYKMAFWTTFLALALGPLDQFQKKFLGTIYQIWWGIGPIFSLLGPKMWEELR